MGDARGKFAEALEHLCSAELTLGVFAVGNIADDTVPGHEIRIAVDIRLCPVQQYSFAEVGIYCVFQTVADPVFIRFFEGPDNTLSVAFNDQIVSQYSA